MINVDKNTLNKYTEAEVKDRLNRPYSHIRLYVQLLVTEFYFPDIDIQDWQKKVFRYFNISPKEYVDWDELDLERNRIRHNYTHKPNPTQIAAALRGLGFGRSNIAEFMKLSESAVNYHMIKKLPYREYICPTFKRIQSTYTYLLPHDQQITRGEFDPTW
jgi:hypothetical protein